MWRGTKVTRPLYLARSADCDVRSGSIQLMRKACQRNADGASADNIISTCS